MVGNEYSITSKIEKMFGGEKIFGEYYVKIYKNHKEKINVDKNGHEYMLFRPDVYFFEFNLVVEVDEKGHNDRDLIF